MPARLIAIAGPMHNRTFTIDGQLSIGREPGNHVCLGTRAASRQHCVIRSDGNRYTIVDLDSRNGTFVNDVPVTEHALAHGDRIAITGSVFVFSLDDSVPQLPAEPTTLEEFDEGLTTVTVARRTPLQIDAKEGTDDLLRQPGLLERVVRINGALTAIRDPESLQRELLTRLLDLTRADCAAVLLFEDLEKPPSSILGLERGGVHVRTIQLSRTIIRRVLHERIGILVTNVRQDRDLAGSDTLVRIGSRAVLAVPLNSRDRIAGILYLDVRHSDRHLTEADLEITTAVAAVAGLALDNAQHFDRLRRQAEALQKNVDRDLNIVGTTPAMEAVYKRIGKVAAADTTVLLFGESGTGKELAAHAIHRASARAEKPFVALNCATFGENLLESELFGHEKGAFTGAIASKRGQLEMADGGTLFLDEVGELATPVQAKLLRVLQEREFLRVGGTRPIQINVRIVAATNRDLRAAVAAGTFREDLWYRLNVIPITLPPLRERVQDIGLLANYFIARSSKKCGRVVTGLSSAAKHLLVQYAWPGNVRELENAIERAVVLGEDDEIQAYDLPETLREAVAISPSADEAGFYEAALNDFKRRLIIEAVQASKGNYTEAARRLGVHVTYLHRLVKNFNLRPMLEKLHT
jgi:transcriptional regulator with GAF, ATPase, and Fis domain